MSGRLFGLGLWLLPLLVAVAELPAAEKPVIAVTVRDLGWICGTWSCPKSGGEFQEHWMNPAGDSLVGCGQLIIGEKTRFVEYLAIEPTPEGLTMFILLGAASKGPKTAKPFRLTRYSTDDKVKEAVFENPQNDFPSLIRYRVDTEGSMLCRLEGMRQGKPVTEDYPFRRAR